MPEILNHFDKKKSEIGEIKPKLKKLQDLNIGRNASNKTSEINDSNLIKVITSSVK